MNLTRTILAMALFSVVSCGEKKDNPATAEKHEQATNRFLGEWIKVDSDTSIKFIAQGNSVLFNDGAKNFNAELRGDKTINVDLSSMSMGIVIFEYSQENDTISALGDTFRRKP